LEYTGFKKSISIRFYQGISLFTLSGILEMNKHFVLAKIWQTW